jgi:CheY-like chemotaxis protein
MKRHTTGPRAQEVFATGHGDAACLVPAPKLPDGPWTEGTNLKPFTDGNRHELPSGARNRDQPIPSHDPLRTTSRRPGVLVVDDDFGLRTLLDAVLWQNGFRVWLAGDGLQARELYQELRSDIDLVLLDVQMPGLDGPHTLAALQRLNSALCCCFMTGGSGEYTSEDLFAQGAVRVFWKPFPLTAVAQLLRQLVDASATQAARLEDHRTTGGIRSEQFLG